MEKAKKIKEEELKLSDIIYVGIEDSADNDDGDFEFMCCSCVMT